VKPKTPAITAMIRKTKAYFSIGSFSTTFSPQQ